jgi:diacylglycerol O-acyltransferase / trehalose O-mycolyltransferase
MESRDLRERRRVPDAVKRALVALAVVAALLPRSASADVSCPRPRCVALRVPVPRGLKVPDSRVRVLLPSGYDRGRARYPVLYLLHGVGDTFESWTQNSDVAAFSRRFPLIIVMPDGGRGSDAGWHSDWKDGTRQWETFHTRVLVKFVDRFFRTLGPRHRAIAGFSMGGFGAMSYAARHRGMFRAAATMSGFVDTMYAAPASGVVYEPGGRGVPGYSIGTPRDGVWGPQMSNEDTWRAHNPTDLAAKLRGVWLYVGSGNGEPGGPAGDEPSRPDLYFNEFFIGEQSQSFLEALDDAGVRYTANIRGGYHDWPYYQYELHRALPMIARAIAR